MTVFKRRTRMVNFRLSEDEYKDLKNMCIAKGSRSISDFARSAVCQLVSSGNGLTVSNGSIDKIESNVHELRGKFEELNREVKRLAQFLSRVSAPRPATVAANRPTADHAGSAKQGQTMRNAQLKLVAGILAVGLTAAALPAQQFMPTRTEAPKPAPVRSTYVLGPDEQITIRVPETDEFGDKPFRIGTGGDLNLPLVGRVHAAGLTVEQLEAELASRLKEYVQVPQVSVGIAQFRSQPVSVIGAVSNPGVQQIQGPKTLVELLSLAGGIRQDAGNSIKITRRLERGRIPLPTAKDDPTGQFSIAEVNVKKILEAKNPEENILVQPDDIISVPRAEMVYVIGDVARAGGFVLNEQENISVLQALSLAGGPNRTAATHKAKVLRTVQGSSSRTEIPMDLHKVLAGKANDATLQPDDILFVPNSTAKATALRSLEAAITMGTTVGAGLAIYRP